MTPPSPQAVAIDHLDVRYGSRLAVADLGWTVATGAIVAVTGPNGSGKSTLLRAIAGLIRPSGGGIVVGGRPLPELPLRERARLVAWMPQEEPLGDEISLYEHVSFGRHPHRARFWPETTQDRAAVEGALRLVDAWEARERSVHRISGGERQRVRLARAIAQDAPIVLLDEPTAHLDVGHQLDVLSRVRALTRENGRTVLVALHDLNLAARFADRILVLSSGRRVAEGPPEAVLSAELLARVWGIEAELRRDRATGVPYLIPVLPMDRTSTPSPGRPHRVHVVAGGGAGAELMRRLRGAGFEFTSGVLHLFDTDTEVAEALGVGHAVETPFAPISAPVRQHLAALLEASEAIVVAPVPFGPANLSNLVDLDRWVGRRPIVFVRPPVDRPWDFTSGEASRRRAELVDRGAVEVADAEAAVAWLSEHLAPPRGDVPPAPRPSAGPPTVGA